MDENQIGTNGETFSEVMWPKLQQKKLWDQIETFAKVMGPKIHFSQQFIIDPRLYDHF